MGPNSPKRDLASQGRFGVNANNHSVSRDGNAVQLVPDEWTVERLPQARQLHEHWTGSVRRTLMKK
jgi:hypothetical protein